MKISAEECKELNELLEESDKAGMLQFVLKSAISFGRSSFLTVLEVINKIKAGKEFDVDDSLIYLMKRDLNNWKNNKNNFNEDISVTIKGFNKIEEAKEFCSWYSGQGEQDASIWFECRKDEGLIKVSSMNELSTSLTSNSNVEMILKMS